MSTTLPPAVLRAALTKVFGSGPVSKSDGAMQLVAEALEEAGYLVVARADMHALRAAADKVLRYSPGQSTWCYVTGCALHGVRDHGHQGGSPTPTRPRGTPGGPVRQALQGGRRQRGARSRMGGTRGMTGAELIAQERARQIQEEGYDTIHDLRVGTEHLTDAAIAYALVSESPGDPKVADRTLLAWWPWSDEAWKPTGDRVRDLTKAGALIAAAIDAELLSFDDPVPDPGEEFEARFETASDGGEM